MNSILTHVAYGWLIFMGVMHFVIDVVSQRLRGLRPPSVETTLYNGLHSSYALGQVLLGVLALFIVRQTTPATAPTWLLVVSAAAVALWFAIGFAFIEYREPKMMLGLFTLLLGAAALTR